MEAVLPAQEKKVFPDGRPIMTNHMKCTNLAPFHAFSSIILDLEAQCGSKNFQDLIPEGSVSFRDVLRCVDAETGEELTLQNGSVKLNLKKHDFRLRGSKQNRAFGLRDFGLPLICNGCGSPVSLFFRL